LFLVVSFSAIGLKASRAFFPIASLLQGLRVVGGLAFQKSVITNTRSANKKKKTTKTKKRNAKQPCATVASAGPFYHLSRN
jgi:hypothetical protein